MSDPKDRVREIGSLEINFEEAPHYFCSRCRERIEEADGEPAMVISKNREAALFHDRCFNELLELGVFNQGSKSERNQ